MSSMGTQCPHGVRCTSSATAHSAVGHQPAHSRSPPIHSTYPLCVAPSLFPSLSLSSSASASVSVCLCLCLSVSMCVCLLPVFVMVDLRLCVVCCFVLSCPGTNLDPFSNHVATGTYAHGPTELNAFKKLAAQCTTANPAASTSTTGTPSDGSADAFDAVSGEHALIDSLSPTSATSAASMAKAGYRLDGRGPATVASGGGFNPNNNNNSNHGGTSGDVVSVVWRRARAHIRVSRPPPLPHMCHHRTPSPLALFPKCVKNNMEPLVVCCNQGLQIHFLGSIGNQVLDNSTF